MMEKLSVNYTTVLSLVLFFSVGKIFSGILVVCFLHVNVIEVDLSTIGPRSASWAILDNTAQRLRIPPVQLTHGSVLHHLRIGLVPSDDREVRTGCQCACLKAAGDSRTQIQEFLKRWRAQVI